MLMISAFSCGAAQHPRLSVANQRPGCPVPECIPQRSCPLPKPPLASQSSLAVAHRPRPHRPNLIPAQPASRSFACSAWPCLPARALFDCSAASHAEGRRSLSKLTFVNQCVGDLMRLTLAHLSDFIAGCHVSQAEDRTALKCSAIMMSKALSWFARIGQIPSLQDLMGSPLIKSFAYNPKPHDRREALPLLLAILAAWEEHIVSPACAPAVGLLLGALLLCAHCSLRFGDTQRIKPSAFSLSAQALRGLCWATKTTCQGQPFACLPFGFRGEDISASWLVKWLALLSQALDATHAEWGDSFVALHSVSLQPSAVFRKA